MKDEKDRRTIEIKVRFSERELQEAEAIEREFGITRAVVLRDLYMQKVRDLRSRLQLNGAAA